MRQFAAAGKPAMRDASAGVQGACESAQHDLVAAHQAQDLAGLLVEQVEVEIVVRQPPGQLFRQRAISACKPVASRPQRLRPRRRSAPGGTGRNRPARGKGEIACPARTLQR